MSDIAGKNLREPDQVDWEKVGKGSTYTPPPPAKGADGNFITYFGQLPPTVGLDVNDEGYRTYTLDPIKIVQANPSVNGYQVRFARTTLKPFKNGANSTAILLKAAGVSAKPQKTAEYDAAMGLVKGKVVPFTLDWVARNKDTGEEIVGYDNFPDDPVRPGTKKSVLKKGDTYVVGGEQKVVESEVLFANARHRFFETKGK